MARDTSSWSRRDFIGAGLGGATILALGGLPRSLMARAAGDGPIPDDLAGKTLNLVLRYRTEPERIARILPPGLEPDHEAHVMLDWWVRYPVPGQENIYFPDIYSECGMHVTARYQGHRGMLQVGMPLDQEWGRTAGREGTGLMKKDGVVRISRDGETVTADLTRRGKLLYRVETRVLDEPAHPLFWHREAGFGQFLYRYRLNPDWRQGPLGDEPVELWLRNLAGRRGWYPEEMMAGGPRGCDLASTRLHFVDHSVLDAFVEFPMLDIVGMSYDETGLATEDARAYQAQAARTQSRIERLQLIDKARFEPWAFYNYDRPITEGRAWVPAGWPETVSAFKLTAEEIRRYRAREDLALEPVEILDVRLRLPAGAHAATLPDVLDPGAEPLLRLLAMRVERSDLSTEPFEELWLLSRCLREGRAGWYALSHVVGPGGDVVFGRETFGYPSKMGMIGWREAGGRVEILGHRMGRDFVRLRGELRTGGADAAEELTVIGLRLHPPYRRMTLHGFTEPGPELELISQPWSMNMAAIRSIDPAHLNLEFPSEPGPGVIGGTDPWYEFAGAAVVGARLGRGAIRRGPGARLGFLEDSMACYLERYDGALTSGEATSGNVEHTFRVRSAG